MIRIFCYNIILFFIFMTITAAGEKDIPRIPVYYPEGTISGSFPYFIWYDKYNERDSNSSTKYKIILKSDKEQDIKSALIIPALYNDHYYFQFPFPLETGRYLYEIERLEDNKTSNVKYFHYLKYPVSGEFILDSSEEDRKGNLPPDKLIDYLTLEKKNRIENGYNFLFYSSASAGSFGIGLLFFTVLDFGLISKIISIIAFTSSAAGLGAAGYYGYNYVKGKNQLQKIADIGRNVSINGSLSATAICTDFSLLF